MIKTVCHNQKVIEVKKLHSKVIRFGVAKPNCRDCKHSFVVNNITFCGLYKYINENLNSLNSNGNLNSLNGYFVNAIDSRSDNNLCGPDAYYFKN